MVAEVEAAHRLRLFRQFRQRRGDPARGQQRQHRHRAEQQAESAEPGITSPKWRSTSPVTATRPTDSKVIWRYSGRLLCLLSMAPRDASDPPSSAIARANQPGDVARAALDVGVDQATNSWAMLSPRKVTVFAIHEHRRRRRFAGAGQRDADVGVARLARAVDDAAHHRQGHVLRPGYLIFHSGILPRTCSCTTLASSRKNSLVVRPQPGQAVTIGVNARRPMVCSSSCATITSCVREAPGSGVSEMDGVADPFLQQHAQRRAGGDDALAADAGLGQAQVQGRNRCARPGRGRPPPVPARPTPSRWSTMRSRGRPISTARSAESMAERDAPRAAPGLHPGLGARVVLVHQPRGQRLWSSEPQLAPIRTGLPYGMANSISWANWVSRFLPKPTLPGLIRYFASASAQAGSFASRVWPL